MKEPENLDVPIWRYGDLAKFIALLDRRALYFCRVDKLGDPFEGSLTREDERRRGSMLAGAGPEAGLLFSNNERMTTRNVAVNCWHMNEQESAAMWRLYLAGSDGVALRSTFRRLKASLDERAIPDNARMQSQSLQIGLVEYVDYDLAITPPYHRRCFYKRKSFEHEREVRALIYREPDTITLESIPTYALFGDGLYVPVDITQLLEAVYVSPTSPPWFADVVRSVVARYGFEFPVQQSRLAEDPIF
jgi:hypothetical protein